MVSLTEKVLTKVIPQTLAPALSLPVLARSVLPILASLVADPIPNIRFNVAKSYAVLIDVFKRLPADSNPNATIVQLEKDGGQEGAGSGGSEKGEKLIKEEVMPNLEKLMQDEDVDVRFFATTAAKGWTDSAMET